MKRLASLSTSVAALLVGACSANGHAQMAQCESIVRNYTQLLGFSERDVRSSEDRYEIDLRFTVKSVFGPKAGSAQCVYPLAADKQISEVPSLVSIGNTEYHRASDIQDLLEGKYRDGKDLPSHDH